jgi:lipopolysaccharide assembly outer membrane protein LptD (OstA)
MNFILRFTKPLHFLILLNAALWASAAPASSSVRDTIVTVAPSDKITADSSIEARSTDSSTVKKQIPAPTPEKPQGLTDTVYYGADGGYIDYDVESKTLKLVGNAEIRYQDITLNADTITYLINDGLLVATGKPQLLERKDTTVGESMIYNIKTKRGRVKYASAHMDDSYFNGNKIVKTDNNELYIDEGDYTTCANIDTPDYFFYGKDVKVIPNKQVISRPVVFALSGAPVATLPYFLFPLEHNRQSGMLTPIYGGHPESGGYIDNIGYYFVPNDYMDFSTWARIQEFRDFVLNGSTRYSMKYWLSGSITGRYATGGDFMAKSDQWSIDFSHNQNITPDGNLTLNGGGGVVGAKSFYRSFSEDSSQLLNQTTRANLALSQRIPAINASAGLSWSRDQNLMNGAVSENLPSLNFSLPSRAIIPFTPKENATEKEKDEPAWYNNVMYSYSANGIMRHTISPGDTGSDVYRKAASQSFAISSPQKVLNYFTVSPYFNTQLSNFDQFMDTTANDTQYTPVNIYDTLSQIDYSKKNSPPKIFDTLLVFNRETQTNDTSFVVIDSVDTLKRPSFHTYDKWNYDLSWKTGVSLSTILYGLFPLRIFNFAGIRHTLTPSVSYNFTPKHNQPYQFNGIVPYERGRDKQSQSIGINLSNEFQGKLLDKPASTGDKPGAPGDKPAEKKFQILSASISTAYDFEAPKRKFSNLSLSASTGYEIVRVSYSSNFWMYDLNDKLSVPLLMDYSVSISPSSSLNLQGTLWEGDKIAADSLHSKTDLRYTNAGPQRWQATISPSYTFSQRRAKPTDVFVTEKRYSLTTSASCNFTRNWAVSWGSNYDFVRNQFVDHNLNFGYNQECWMMSFQWRPGGYNPGYYFIINIKKIPEIKWDMRG